MQSFSFIGFCRAAYEVCMNFQVDMHSCKKSFSLVLVKLCPIDIKLKLDKMKSTGGQLSMIL